MTTTAEKYTTEQTIHNTLAEGKRYDDARKERAVTFLCKSKISSKQFGPLKYDDDEDEWEYTYGKLAKLDVAKIKIYSEEEARTMAYDSLYEQIKEEYNGSGLPHKWSNYMDIDGLIEDAIDDDGVMLHCGLECEYSDTYEFPYEGDYYYMGVDYYEEE